MRINKKFTINTLVVLLFLFFVSMCHAQNAVTLLRAFGRVNAASICRTVTVPSAMIDAAIGATMFQQANHYNINETGCFLQVELEKKVLLESLKSPTNLYGPYNYLRAYTKLSQERQFVNKKFLEEWKKLNKTQGYNGVHHLISKGTIKMLYIELKKQGKKVNLTDMENNAPAIFHPMHGNPEYKDVFHNLSNQYYDYKKFGMKITIISLLERIDEINVKIGLKPFPEWYLKGVLKEAELWCKYYGLVWEMPEKTNE